MKGHVQRDQDFKNSSAVLMDVLRTSAKDLHLSDIRRNFTKLEDSNCKNAGHACEILWIFSVDISNYRSDLLLIFVLLESVEDNFRIEVGFLLL